MAQKKLTDAQKLRAVRKELKETKAELADAKGLSETLIEDLAKCRFQLHTAEFKLDGLQDAATIAEKQVAYYEAELAKAHAILGRTTHQLSEHTSNMRLNSDFPTANTVVVGELHE